MPEPPARPADAMPTETDKTPWLRLLPAVERLLVAADADARFELTPRGVRRATARAAVDEARARLLQSADPPTAEALLQSVLDRMAQLAATAMRPRLRPVVNATGVVIHTNLGRSPLADAALDNITRIAAGYSNLEYNLEAGHRGSRYSAVEDLICEISGAEAAMVVNNNAAAVLLCLETLARGREVIVSRGELVEIGGAFRVPDIMARSGGILREVGTTNRTHLRDYQGAIGSQSALLLKVHTSNFSIVGFTASVALADLVRLGGEHGLPVMEDLGSGTFVDFGRYGLAKEPTVQESVASGADVVTFSGDKLLGGPQAGLIVGRREIMERIKNNPLTRALRIDKLTLAGLESTLRLYRDETRAMEAIPTLRLLTLPITLIRQRAERLFDLLQTIADERLELELCQRPSKAGGGSLPLLELPSVCVALRVGGVSAGGVERSLRRGEPPIVGRIEEERLLLDARTIQDAELPLIQAALRRLLAESLP
jgi:L-seryl-tRNA(Ser) seleniumtransferase